MDLPYVTVSYAQTLDGRIATRTGDSQWIGGAESLNFAHQLRDQNQVILVGIQTVLQDNPRLTCRIPGGRNPVRVVLDRQLRLPQDCALVQTLDQAPVWVYTSPEAALTAPDAWHQPGIRLCPVPETATGLDLNAVLQDLALQGIRSVFVEGGARILTAFLKADRVDRLIAVTAPWLLGQGIEAIGDLGILKLDQARRPLRWRRWDLGADQATELIFREPV